MDKYIIKKGEKHKKKAISPKNNPRFYRPLQGLQNDRRTSGAYDLSNKAYSPVTRPPIWRAR